MTHLATQHITAPDFIPQRLTPVARNSKAYRAWLKARLREYAEAVKLAKANGTPRPNITEFIGAL